MGQSQISPDDVSLASTIFTAATLPHTTNTRLKASDGGECWHGAFGYIRELRHGLFWESCFSRPAKADVYWMWAVVTAVFSHS